LCSSCWLALPPLTRKAYENKAKTQGGTAENRLNMRYGVATLSELATISDLVIHARILSVTALLTPDETNVVTDYQLMPIQILKSKVIPAGSRPGRLTPLVARRPGGVVIEGQYRMVTSISWYPKGETLRIGEEAVLFLSSHSSGQFYSFTGGPYGIFRVREGQVEAMTKQIARLRQDSPRPLAAFLRDVELLIQP
jgi:hypothetical protein